MSLTIVSVPIGNYGDITLRAIETLKSARLIICEEIKPASILLKKLGIGEKEFHQLNEHSKPSDVTELVTLCRHQDVALVSDCGTPGFCDPGANLVQACYQEKIPVNVNPGASSLMALIALAGENLKEFYFVGFLPAEKESRQKKIKDLKLSKVPFVVMDTPYRLQATLQELEKDFGNRTVVLGVDLTSGGHHLEKGPLKELAQKTWSKQPFVLLVTAH